MRKPVKLIDRRIAKTKLALRDALLSLLVVKHWDDISILEICEHANIGRSTFYLRYQSKDDLLTESLNDLRDFLIANSEPAHKSGFGFLRGLLEHIAEQRAVFKAVIGKRGGQSVASRFKEMVRQLIEIEFKRNGVEPTKTQWLSRYLAGGVVEAMSWWIDVSRPPTIEEMERRLEALARQALRVD